METPSATLSGSEFVDRLVDELDRLFRQLEARETLEAESEGEVEVVTLLELALRSELEAAEVAGLWMPTTPEIDVKLAFARQCGDEMRHYELITERLRQLGREADSSPLPETGYSALYRYLRTLNTSVERVAAGPFACEAVAEVRNAQFIEFCESVGDVETARLYREVIQPEEVHHNRMGRELLARYCTTPELQQRASMAMRNSLAIADELRSLTARATGLQFVPMS